MRILVLFGITLLLVVLVEHVSVTRTFEEVNSSGWIDDTELHHSPHYYSSQSDSDSKFSCPVTRPNGVKFTDPPGCWEVTGRVGDSSLTFITLVVKIGEGPVRSKSW